MTDKSPQAPVVQSFKTGRNRAVWQVLAGMTAELVSRMRIPPKYDPDQTITRKAYKQLRHDPVIERIRRISLAKIAGTTWHLEAPSQKTPPELVELFTEIIGEIDNFTEFKHWLAESLWEGSTWLRLYNGDFDGFNIPKTWTFVPKWHFQMQTEQLGDNSISWYWNIFNPVSMQWEKLENKDLMYFLRSAYEANEENNFSGLGLFDVLYPIVAASIGLIKIALKGTERFAYPMITIATDFGDMVDDVLDEEIGDSDITISTERMRELMKAFIDMRNGGIVLAHTDDKIDVVDMGGKGNQVIIDMLQYLDTLKQEVALSTSAGITEQGGSYAKAQTGREQMDDHLAYLQNILVEQPMNTLIKRIYEQNYNEFAKRGFGNVQLPIYKQGEVGKDEPRDRLPIYQLAATMKVKVKAHQFYSEMGLEMPDGVPDVIELADEAQNPQGMPPQVMTASEIPANQVQFSEDKTESMRIEKHLMKQRKYLQEAIESIYKKSITGKSQQLTDEETQTVMKSLRGIQAISKLYGSFSILKEIKQKNKKPSVDFNELMFDNTLPYGDYDKSTRSTTSYDQEFIEALSDIIQRNPELASSAEELRQYYLIGVESGEQVFGAVAAETIDQLNQVREVIKEKLESGELHNVNADIQEIVGNSKSYASTVWRTASMTSYSAGRERQVRDLGDFIAGYEFYSVDDSRARPNHTALDRLRAPVDWEGWEGRTPPLGYNCRCIKRPITIIEARDEKWLDAQGKLKLYKPPRFASGGADYESFGKVLFNASQTFTLNFDEEFEKQHPRDGVNFTKGSGSGKTKEKLKGAVKSILTGKTIAKKRTPEEQTKAIARAKAKEKKMLKTKEKIVRIASEKIKGINEKLKISTQNIRDKGLVKGMGKNVKDTVIGISKAVQKTANTMSVSLEKEGVPPKTAKTIAWISSVLATTPLSITMGLATGGIIPMAMGAFPGAGEAGIVFGGTKLSAKGIKSIKKLIRKKVV